MIEVYEFEKSPFKKETIEWGDPEKSKVLDWWESEQDELTPEEREADNKKRSLRRARNNIRRLAVSNFGSMDKFITLTFRDETYEGKGQHRFKVDWTNVEHTNQCFKTFIQRLRRYTKKKGGDTFQYIAVHEIQEKNDRGAIHYHMMANLDYIPYEELGELWGHGFIGINRMDKVRDKKGKIRSVDNVGAYMVKYMMKSKDERLKGKKAYLTSKGLIRPEVFRGDTAEAIIEHLGLNEKKEHFSNSYTTEMLGNCLYKEYNLKRI